ncbi:MAG: lytic murein transglycosylase, partial [Candidatus Anstonellaceae archaeon]
MEFKAKKLRNTAAHILLATSIASMSFFYTSKIMENTKIEVKNRNTVVENKTLVQNKIIMQKPTFSKKTMEIAKNYLISKGFSENEIDSVFSDSRIEKLNLFQKKEKKAKRLSYTEYKKIFNIEKLSDAAVPFYLENRKLLDSLSISSGVPYQLVLSILGIESSFGKNLGKHIVINTYLSMVEDVPNRTNFALREIAALLRISKKYSKHLFEIKGSHGGAIGPMQFIPTSIEKFDTMPRKNFDELIS